jgi:subtilase family serine protease
MHMNRIPGPRPYGAGPPRRWRWIAAVSLAACLTGACTSTATTRGTAAATSAAAVPVTASAPSASAATVTVDCGPPGAPKQCYSPQAYQLAYGVAPLLSRGIDGSGETVVMPELAQAPASSGGSTDIRQDLAAFDSKFDLPPARLQVVNTIAKSKTPYLADGKEEVEDTEMVHAIAPGAILDVVLLPADVLSSNAAIAAALTQAIQAGVALHAAVISISASGGEHLRTRAGWAAMNAALQQAREQHVTVIASSGDTGAISDDGPPRQVSMPASDPLVLAVGGTTLDAARPSGTYHAEIAWNDGANASGGGYSGLFPRPSYQNGLARAGATRGVPDVAANAAPATAMAIEYSDGHLRPAEGTSAATPLWAGVIALADQQAGQHLGLVNPAIYAIARGPAYHQTFHDVTTGDNSVLWHSAVIAGYHAGPGWDPVTGWGSPDAQYLVPLIAHTALA